MEASDVIVYVKEKLCKFEHAKGLKCKEIGDGLVTIDNGRGN